MLNENLPPFLMSVTNKLRSDEPIESDLIDQLCQFSTFQASSRIGLLSVLYNCAIQPIQQKSDENKDKQIKKKDQGDVLKLRGDILSEYAKFLGNAILEPAYSLIRFDYQSFKRYCNDRGLEQLIRNSKGLYPQIDTKYIKPLQFLPAYKEIIQESSPIIVGNLNWETARHIVSSYFESEIKDSKEYQQTVQKQLYIGINLCYFIFTHDFEALEKYVENLKGKWFEGQIQNQNQNQLKQLADKLDFWIVNYKAFLTEGLDYYINSQNLDSKENQKMSPIVYDLQNAATFQQVLIYLIAQVYEQNNQNSKMVDEQNNKNQHLYRRLMNYIQNSTQSPQIGSVNEKLLMIAIVYKIFYHLNIQIDHENPAFNAFLKQIKYTQPEEQLYYTIFFTDQQVIKLYEDGKLTKIPTLYNFGEDNFKNILRTLIKNNPSHFNENIQRINKFQLFQQFDLILNGGIIGDFERINNVPITPGQHALEFLKQNQQKFKKFIQSPVDPNMIFSQFISEWENMYKGIRKFTIESFQQYLQKFQNSLAKSETKLKSKESIKKMKKQNFVLPISLPKSAYFLINKFYRETSEIKQQYLLLLQAQQTRIDQIKELKAQLQKRKLILQKTSFKLTLKILGQKTQSLNINWQKFQDEIWKLNSELTLMFPSDRLIKYVQKSGNQDQIEQEPHEDSRIDQEQPL